MSEVSSPQQKSIQQNALGWVKKSIDDSLSASESDLKLYIEKRDPALITEVVGRLQTLQGALLMIEQFGAAMLAEEMISLAQYIENDSDKQSDSALEVLMRAVLQLPDYLEHIQSGQQDNPIIILPILNDIRAVRNQDLFSEKLLFLPDLSMHQESAGAEEVTDEQNQASKLLVKKLRPVYQISLLNLIKDQNVEDSLKKMARVFETLEAKSSVEQMARIWWIIGAMIESLSLQQLELGVSVKNLLGKVDALFRVMLIIGEQGVLKRQPIDLIKNFLYYIGQPECDGPKARAIKTAYRLEQFLPTEAARTRTLERIAGPNQAVLRTVAEAIKGDIETVKSTLEVYVNNDLSEVGELQSLPDELRVISDTLAMIGLGPKREMIKEQIAVVEQILSGDTAVSDDKLVSIAEDLLQIEQALDHLQRNRLQDDAGIVEPGEDGEINEYELEEVLGSVVSAALDNIQRTKDAILDFIQDSGSDEKIRACLPLLEEAGGAMRILAHNKAVAVLDDLVRYLTHCDIVDFMEASRLDGLSQVVASIEYYLEALGEHRADAENILEFAEAQMENLLAGVTIDDAAADEDVELELVEEAPEASLEQDLPAVLDENDAETLDLEGVESGTSSLDEPVLENTGFDESDEPSIPESSHPVNEIELEEEPPAQLDDINLELAEADIEPQEPDTGGEEFKIDFEDEGLDQEAEFAVLEPHDEFASPLDLMAEQAANLAAASEAELEPDYSEPPVDDMEAEALEMFSLDEDEVDIGVMALDTVDDLDGQIDDVLLSEPDAEPEPSFEPEPSLESEPSLEPEPEVASQPSTGGQQVVPVDCDEVVLKPDVDQDILEIYLEEAGEEAENIQEAHQQWASNSDDPDALVTIRRAFHTIKGSGRLVGALKIGEFAWDFENLLNRVIDGSVPVTGSLIDAVGEAGAALVELVAELEGGEPPRVDIAYLRGLARALIEHNDPDNPIVVKKSASAAAVDPADAATAERVPPMPADDDSDVAPDNSSEASQPVDSSEPERRPSIEERVEAMVSSGSLDGAAETEVPHDPFVETTSTPRPENGVGETLSMPQEQTEETGLSFDPDLLKIYQQEVEQHLSTLSTGLKQAAISGELVPSESLYRCLHTIHGASRTADIATLAELAVLMEKPLKTAASQYLALDGEAIELFTEGHRALQNMTEELVKTRQLPEVPEDLRARLKAYAEDIAEHTVEVPEDQAPSGEFIDTLSMMVDGVEDEQDNELLMIFIDEANELLEISDSTFDKWSGNPDDSDFSEVMELQRYLHTLKGGARMASLNEISDLSHELESVFIAVIDGRVGREGNLMSAIRSAFDLLHVQVDAAANNNALPDPVQYIEKLKRLRLGLDDEPDELDEPSPEKPEAEAPADQPDVATVSSADPEPVVPATANQPRQDHVAEQPARDVVRVRSELLDNLVNSAGEASIYRARMEQQVSGLGSYLGELGQTIARLQGQLRDLEAETEAQIHYSHREEGPASEDFDPLEMDRYTMIQELSRSLSESVNDLSSLQHMLGDQVKESETLLLQQSRINTELQEGLVKSRMVRFSGLASRLRRLVRQSSQEVGKKAELVVNGQEQEIDNKVLDRIVAPLEHLIRNAIAHGIEPPVERVKKSKPETGTISIDISRDGSDIVIVIGDDGAGIDVEKVRSRALNQGLITADQKLTDPELIRLILQPGFSTASQVTQMAGRGVGMDVVDVEVKHLGGILQIESTPGGSRFIMRLPFTLSINRAILVKAGEENYAIPLMNIEGVARLDNERLLEAYQLATPQLDYVSQTFRLHYLPKLVGTALQYQGSPGDPRQSVIFCRSGDSRIALHVDELIGNREIVVKNLGKQLGQVKSISGASILADGSVVLILDIAGLVELYTGNQVSVVLRGQGAEEDVRHTIMVVDDSITMRRVASKLLERNNYEVVTAKDGMDALAQLEETIPDLMLLDIEMPRMDGFELATHMRNDDELRNIPIIMITSRTGEKHQQRANEIGVDDYMGKPYQEEELLGNIRAILNRK